VTTFPDSIASASPIGPHDVALVERAGTRWQRWRRSPNLVIGGLIVAIIVMVAIVSLFWTPYNPLAVDTAHVLAGPSTRHWLGTDEYGRDLLSRLMSGSQVAMFVGTLSVVFATVIGVPAGLLAAQRGGVVSHLVLRFADILYGFPVLLAAVVLVAGFGASTIIVVWAIGIAYIPIFIRVTRSNALVVLQSEYVMAARAYGRRPLAIMRRHVVPNIATTMIAQMSLLFALAILAEAGLDFLGLGTTAPTASWGTMLQESQNYLSSDSFLIILPSIAIIVCVLGFALLGDGIGELRDARSDR
jgi:peptide/nickel transport system permease protein